MSEPVRVAISGAAGQIAYSLIPLISKGDVFGPNQSVILQLLDIPPMMGVLGGVVMEIEDAAYPLVKDVIATDDVEKAFKDIDVAFLLGSMPRKQGMERRDLLAANVKIFKAQGEALDKFAKKTVKVLVVGNPANTNALICLKHAPSIPKENFSALTRLDQNRATGNVAKQLNVTADKIQNVIIWGNHSSTQVPDVNHAKVELNGKLVPVTEALKGASFSTDDFIKEIQTRGGAVIAARKMSSALSAAKASADHIHDIWHGIPANQYVSMGVYSDGSYDVPKDIVFSFPVKLQNKQFKIVEGLPLDNHIRGKLDITAKELLEERDEALLVCNN